MDTSEREQLRATFDRAAGLYQEARPEYPARLYDELVAAAGIGPDDRLLEVGCATGKATLPLARRGLAITCLEIGAGLAAAARRNLAAFPAVEVINASFETWQPPPGETFDLVFAATSWHWIDPATRYQQAWSLLAPGGQLAFWGQAHVFPDGGDPFFRDIQDVYDEIGEGLPPGTVWPRPGAVPDSRADIEASGLFGDVVVRQFDWEVSYDADGYIGLLDTFSGHIAMAEPRRQRLYAEIRRRLGQRPDGRLWRHWGSVLHVARRLDRSLPRA
ncbi:MAG TPA: methyltransferase domain-containing protein [Streptosporangiaceae bacterium]|nr:methyltransferase domain-containing protein [Streptosporangiaceae bacterium]